MNNQFISIEMVSEPTFYVCGFLILDKSNKLCGKFERCSEKKLV